MKCIIIGISIFLLSCKCFANRAFNKASEAFQKTKYGQQVVNNIEKRGKQYIKTISVSDELLGIISLAVNPNINYSINKNQRINLNYHQQSISYNFNYNF